MNVKQEIKERIVAAANALVTEGIESPTNEQVRERMGGGSLSHISPVMREWRESRKAEVVAALEMPAEMKKAVETSMGQLWAAASKLATTAVERYRQEAEAAMTEAIEERDEALTEIQRLEGRIAELQKALADKDQVIVLANAELERARAQAAKLTADRAALQARIEDRDNQIEGLKADLKEIREDSRKLQAELVAIAKKAKE